MPLTGSSLYHFRTTLKYSFQCSLRGELEAFYNLINFQLLLPNPAALIFTQVLLLWALSSQPSACLSPSQSCFLRSPRKACTHFGGLQYQTGKSRKISMDKLSVDKLSVTVKGGSKPFFNWGDDLEYCADNEASAPPSHFFCKVFFVCSGARSTPGVNFTFWYECVYFLHSSKKQPTRFIIIIFLNHA